MKFSLISLLLLLFSIYLFKGSFLNLLHFKAELFSETANYTGSSYYTKYPTVKEKRNKRIPIILLWNFPPIITLAPVKKNCGDCLVTRDSKMEEQSDAIIFHYRRMKNLPNPDLRRKEQVYVWLCKESPRTTREVARVSFKATSSSFFNATMTYRHDSTILLNYLEMIYRHKQNSSTNFVSFYHRDVTAMMSSKRHKVLWLVENCRTTVGATHRHAFVMKLIEAGLDITVFGKCLPYLRPFPPFSSEASYQKMSKYKFYIAFENSYHCREYVTEKFWDNSIYNGAIPIVWGPSQDDLKDLAPPYSYIHTEDFNNDIRELVDYIEYVDRNEKEYLKYFQWRLDLQEMDAIINEAQRNNDSYDNDFRFKELAARFSNYKLFLKDRRFGLCSLCHHLHSGRQFPPLKSMKGWWYGSENNACMEFKKPRFLA